MFMVTFLIRIIIACGIDAETDVFKEFRLKEVD